jgi:ribonuclease HI
MLKLFCDGASKGNPGPASIGVYGEKDGKEFFSISKAIGTATNNVAEWTALLNGLQKCIELNEKQVNVFLDSELVVKQYNGQYKTKHPDLIPIKTKVMEIARTFEKIQIQHVRREYNKIADRLANKAFE